MAERRLPPPPKAQPQKRPDGVLRVTREQAAKWVPWFVDQAKSCGLGPEAGIVRFASLVQQQFDAMGDKPGIAFPMSESFKLTLVDFHRKILRNSLHPFMVIFASGWRGAGQIEPEIPPDELQRAKSDLAKPYVEVPYKPTEPVTEKKPENSLF